jgi:RNA polymerase sigma-70 factor (ECF subfamily)
LKPANDLQAAAARRVSDTRPSRSEAEDAYDQALMRRVVERDRSAFATLADRHASFALGLAQRIVRNATDAEDVVQESLIRLWVFAERWKPETARFSSWFYRIVINQAISRVRRKPAEPLDSIVEPADGFPGPHEQLAGREIGRAIAQAIGRLPARQRAAIALCYDNGLSCAEAAEAMDVSVGTMESLLFRARRSLRQWLEPYSIDLQER